MTNIFIDSSGFKAVFDKGDEFHHKAQQLWSSILKEQTLLTTSNYILDETYTLFRSHVGKEKALTFRDRIAESPRSIRIVWIQRNDEKRAWDYFEKLPGRGVSFTDCTSFAVMERLGLTTAFTFDEDFKVAGFRLISR